MKAITLLALLAIVGFVFSEQTLYITPDEPMTVTLSATDYIVSAPITPPFRVYYQVSAENPEVLLDTKLLSTADFLLFQASSTAVVTPFAELSETAKNSIEKKRVNFINARKEDPVYLTISINPATPIEYTNATITYYFDYIHVFIGLELWSFALVSAVLGAISIVVFIVFLYFMVTLFIKPCCDRHN